MSDTMPDAAAVAAPEQEAFEADRPEVGAPSRRAGAPVARRGSAHSPTGRAPGPVVAPPPILPRASGTVRRVLALQQTVGNRAVTQLLERAPRPAFGTTVLQRSPSGARTTAADDDTARHAASLHEFRIDGTVFHVRAGRETKDLRLILRTLATEIGAGKADNLAWKKDTNILVRGVSDILGGTSFPDPAMWDEPLQLVQAATAGFDHRGDVEATCQVLGQAVAAYERCSEKWRAYQGDAGTGAGRAATGLKFTEDAAIAIDTTLLTDGLGDYAAGMAGLSEEAVTGAGVAARTGETLEGAGGAVTATPAKAFLMKAARAGVKAGTAGLVATSKAAAEELYADPPDGFSWRRVLEEGLEKAVATFLGGLGEGWITSLLQRRWGVLSRELMPEGLFDKLYVESRELLEAQGVKLTRKMFMSRARLVFTNAIERLPTAVLANFLEEAAKKVFEAAAPEHEEKSSEAAAEENERFGIAALEIIAGGLKEDFAVLLKDAFVKE